MTLDHVLMQAVLRAYYVGIDVAPRLLDAAVHRNAHLEAQAWEWGWDDTDVRERLLDAVCEELGLSWPTGQNPEAIAAMEEQFERAHEHWVAVHA